MLLRQREHEQTGRAQLDKAGDLLARLGLRARRRRLVGVRARVSLRVRVTVRVRVGVRVRVRVRLRLRLRLRVRRRRLVRGDEVGPQADRQLAAQRVTVEHHAARLGARFAAQLCAQLAGGAHRTAAARGQREHRAWVGLGSG